MTQFGRSPAFYPYHATGGCANDIDHTVGPELPLLKRQPSRANLDPTTSFLSIALIIVVLPDFVAGGIPLACGRQPRRSRVITQINTVIRLPSVCACCKTG